jgi:RNA polymerase subunit RPABC4/transcription elongation factor Spt4
MATQSCLDCKEAVSPAAYHCPHCRRLTNTGQMIFIVRVTLLAVIAANLFWYQPF